MPDYADKIFMKKLIYASFFFLAVAAAGYTYFLPKYFHAQVHTALIPQIAGADKVAYAEDQHQSVLQRKDSSLTITSHDSLNPLEYHIEVQYKRNNSQGVHTAKIFPAFSSKELGLKVVFENFIGADQKGKISTKNVFLNFTTPLSKAVLTHWKNPKYFLTNAKGQFFLGEIAISTKDKNSFIMKDFTAAIDLTSGVTNNLVITKDFKFNELNITLDGKNTISKDFTSQIVVDSINKSGVPL